MIYPVNYLFFLYASKIYLPRIMKKYFSGESKVREIRISSPKAIKLAENDNRFMLIEHDLLEPSKINGTFNIIRAMNVLNPEYFNIDQLRKAVSYLFLSLDENGLLILGSNEGPGTPVQGGIYRKTGDKFNSIKLIGQPQYAHRAVLDFRQ